MNWYLKVLKHYADFKGRARRKEYWMAYLFNAVFGIIAIALDIAFGIGFDKIGGYGPFYLLYNLAVALPMTAVAVRRLHDVGRSGWMFLILFIPIIGAIWLFILLITPGTMGENKYGKNPKEIAYK